ncbi:sterol desaturase family protein [Reyranella aquatilis]|uniref:Sterol desaturase family protein n=1 Tax=Reyranella aquatilis TaxID=2035356 RepID=A0ABS8KW40_9HYPH|nr:sterol desaturase family protein [Reyranella aquatilis]MCC8430298.1 sterol desaturase family protein [Reyranella aquatilis]
MTRRFPWLDYLLIVTTVAALAYVVAVAGATLGALDKGATLDAAVFAQWPVSDLAYWYVPVLLAIYGAEVLHLGWHASPLSDLLQSPSRSHRSDVFYLAVELLGLGPLFLVVASLGMSAGLDAVLSEPRAWRPAAELPLLIAVPLHFLADSFFTYWSHRFLHSPLMWPFHAIHHAAKEMTAITTTRHHPVDGFFGMLVSTLPAVLFGFTADAVFIAAVSAGVATTILHTRLPVPAWYEKLFVAGPRIHGIHHSSDPADHNANFSLFTPWDRLFGTYRWHERPLVFGVHDPRFDTGHPLLDLFAVYPIWLAGVRDRVTTALSARLSRRIQA